MDILPFWSEDMKRILFLFSSFIVFTLAGCSFFTTSWGEGARRDLGNRYAKLSSSELADLISDPMLINDTESSNQLLTALGERDDLSSLSAEQKNGILNLSVNTSITADTVSEILSIVQDAVKSGDDNVEGLVASILEKVNASDTQAVTKLLSDKDKLGELDGKALCLSSVCLVAQVAKKENIVDKADEIQEEIEKIADDNTDVDTAVNTILKDLDCSQESKDSLKAALNVVDYLKDSDEELVGGVKISDIFSSL